MLAGFSSLFGFGLIVAFLGSISSSWRCASARLARNLAASLPPSSGLWSSWP
ncbi:MAG: hypothetical protein R3A44_44575 [Caldilineaceae bacterium]